MGEYDFRKFCHIFSERFYVMACPLDSYYWKGLSVGQFHQRVAKICDMDGVEYVEVGNEVGGDWLGDITDVAAKVIGALEIIEETEKERVITWYLDGDDPEMNRLNTVRTLIDESYDLDGVWELLSFYENWTPEFFPKWEQLAKDFDGIGEYGPHPEEYNHIQLRNMIQEYEMDVVSRFGVGGFFWDASKHVFSEKAPMLELFGKLWSKDRNQERGNKKIRIGKIESHPKAAPDDIQIRVDLLLSAAFKEAVGFVPKDFAKVLSKEMVSRIEDIRLKD